MDDQTILACDDNGKFLEYIPKIVGHTGDGRRHLAITVLLVNKKGEVLLQKRRHKIFDNVWDFTASTHPLHKEDGTNESLEEATRRALKDEWGISPSTTLRIKEVGEFNYFTKDGENCENEHCIIFVGEYDSEVYLDPKAGYEYKWMDKDKFLEDVKINPRNYTPWVKEGIKFINNLTI